MAIGIATTETEGASISVIGVGGGGGNAINNMIEAGLDCVTFIAANTDKQALNKNLAKIKIQMGKDENGRGAGGKPEIGKKAAEESLGDMKEYLKSAEMVFVTAGMGGGTGTGAAPVIAKTAKEMGILVVGIVTRPFEWEGKKRIQQADNGIAELKDCVDALIVIPNQRLLDVVEVNTTFIEAFKMVDEVLYNATRGISDIISNTGLINVDFADVKSIMTNMGDAIMGIGKATGKDRAVQAAQAALNSPLLEGITIAGSKGVLINVTGSTSMTIHESAHAVSLIQKVAGDDANLIYGTVIDDNMGDEIKVTVVATGFKKEAVQSPANNNGKFTPGIEEPINFPGNNQTKEPVKVQSPVIKPPKPGFGIKQTEYPKITIAAGSNNRIITSIPRGDEELKHYDTPAVQRRRMMDLTKFGSDGTVERFEKLNEAHFQL